jgi:non-homologous end joining protein Ku
VPDGKVGHDAFAVVRETIREMNKVAIGRVVLTNLEHIIALEPMDKSLMGTLLRYPYEVRSADEYFDDIQEVKVTKDMLDLARHIVNQVISSRTSSKTSTKPRSSISSTRNALANRSPRKRDRVARTSSICRSPTRWFKTMCCCLQKTLRSPI